MPPGKKIRRKMLNNRKRFHNYLLIATSNFLDIPEFLRWQNYVRTVQDKRVSELLTKIRGPKELIDIYRFYFLYRNPEYWYADCDCLVKKIFKTVPGFPYFGAYKDKCDNFLICGNGCSAYFNTVITDVLNRVRTFGETIALAQHAMISRSSHIIPERCFQHG